MDYVPLLAGPHAALSCLLAEILKALRVGGCCPSAALRGLTVFSKKQTQMIPPWQREKQGQSCYANQLSVGEKNQNRGTRTPTVQIEHE